MHGRTESGRVSKKTNIVKNYRGQDVVESHDRLTLEGTQQKEDRRTN